jgi:hypothetical protein
MEFLTACHEIDRFGHFLQRRAWDHDRSMMIGMHDIVVRNRHAEHVDLDTEVDTCTKPWLGATTGRDTLKLRAHHLEVAHRAIGDRAYAAQAPMDIRVDLTPERAQAALAVDILNHGDGRLIALCQRFIVAEQFLLARRAVEGDRAADQRGACIADDRRQLRKRRDHALAREPGREARAQCDLDGVGDGRSIELAQMIEQGASIHHEFLRK